MRLCLIGFVAPLVVVFARAVQLEFSEGAAFRSEAAKPLVRRQSLPGVRGRILARNGTVLAYDNERLIGAARAISDGEREALIVGVAVLPDFQGKRVDCIRVDPPDAQPGKPSPSKSQRSAATPTTEEDDCPF